jgi:uncharacterized protein
MKDLKLTEIWIYPIKSLGGIQLSSSKVMQKGLPLDRRWMLVDDTGRFMTQRVTPQMALFKLLLTKDHLSVQFGKEILNVPIEAQPKHAQQNVTIWDDTVQAFEVDSNFSAWFSEHLNMHCKLVHFPEENPRAVDPKYKVNDEHVSLADAYPFLVIGESTLQDLNSRLDAPVPMNRFRPNFVYSGGNAFEEDTWRNFTIGKNAFVGVKPCARCILTTVNQDTAQKTSEPLKTLASYRTKNNKVYFGQNLVAVNNQEIKVGDSITIDSYQ